MRAPYQVLVLLYRLSGNQPEFCVFHRRSPIVWQFVSGGGENAEQPEQAAYREIFEETGLEVSSLYPLTALAHVPAAVINEKRRQGWPDSTYVLPEYPFAAQVNAEPVLSEEHTEYRWCTYEQAQALLRFDSNKIALYELNCRLTKMVLPWKV